MGCGFPDAGNMRHFGDRAEKEKEGVKELRRELFNTFGGIDPDG